MFGLMANKIFFEWVTQLPSVICDIDICTTVNQPLLSNELVPINSFLFLIYIT